MNDLRNQICNEISRSGPMPFPRFMERCLYAPGLGYYETPRAIGRAGDFYTSVSVGPLFGQLLAQQFADWLGKPANPPRPVQVVEAAAHDGRLAADILDHFASRHPELYESLHYYIVEPSAVRRTIQQQALSRFGATVQWFDHLEFLPPIHGVFFSNELLDAFPVHRVLWNAEEQCWRESCVGVDETGFTWTQSPLTFDAAEIGVPGELLPHLPDGFVFEVTRAAQTWWQHAAGKLRSGKLIALDYGYTVEEYFRAGKTNGTLRAYKQHHVTDQLLADVGQQDITAHVNFDAIQLAGERAGLITDTLTSQSQFLTQIFQRLVTTGGFDASAKAVKQFQTLTSPEHLGRFRVLIQSRNPSP